MPDGPTSDASGTSDSFGFQRPDDEWLSRLRRAETRMDLGRLGEYVLLCELGRGAQGVVYKAVQPHTRRIVALKRLAAGSLATPAMRERFEREIEAACLLDHPGIVTVHGVEVLEGQPVLTMEWVDGHRIDTWASGPPARALPEVLGVFAQACDAVAHAHRRGVLHRDLKPSNVLVDEQGRARVLDFGLAKVLPEFETWADATVTNASGFLGTPAYGAPEALEHPDGFDTRSDVYALGIILYKLLSGTLPFDVARGVPHLFDQIRRGVTRPPSALRAGVDRELDAIVLKASAVEPERRYATPEDLAADVRRKLAGEAVAAHPPGRAYLIRTFVRRHRAAVALVVGAFVLISALAVTATVFAVNLSRERVRLRESLDSERAAVARAVEARNAAEASTREARAAIVRAARQFQRYRAVADLLGVLWSEAEENPAAGAELQAGIDRAIARLAAAETSERPAPATLALRSLAEALQDAASFEHAEQQAREALRFAEELDGPESRPAAQALVVLGQIQASLGRLAEAEASLREADRLRLVNNPTDAGGSINAIVDLGRVLIDQGRAAEAEALFRGALQARSDPGDRVTVPIIPLHRGLGAALIELGRYAEAEEEIHRALQMPPEYENWEPEGRPLTGRHRARILQGSGRHEEAEQEIRSALDRWAFLLHRDHPRTAAESIYLGSILADRGKLDEAGAVYESAIERLGARLPAHHFWLTRARIGLASVLIARSEHDRAMTLLRETLAHALEAAPGSEILIAEAAARLGRLQHQLSAPAEGAATLDAARAAIGARLEPDHPLVPLCGAILDAAAAKPRSP